MRERCWNRRSRKSRPLPRAARRELTAYAADLAVGLAQKQIHVDAATDQALVRNFAGELGVSEASGPGKDGH